MHRGLLIMYIWCYRFGVLFAPQIRIVISCHDFDMYCYWPYRSLLGCIYIILCILYDVRFFTVSTCLPYTVLASCVVQELSVILIGLDLFIPLSLCCVDKWRSVTFYVLPYQCQSFLFVCFTVSVYWYLWYCCDIMGFIFWVLLFGVAYLF